LKKQSPWLSEAVDRLPNEVRPGEKQAEHERDNGHDNQQFDQRLAVATRGAPFRVARARLTRDRAIMVVFQKARQAVDRHVFSPVRSG
jgi:hypothetical protein